jgi:F-type H+-transporting ATPase subunit c
VRTRLGLVFAIFFVVLGFTAPLYAQEAAAAATGGTSDLVKYSIVIGGAGLLIAACVGAWSQSKALRSAAESIARNPAAAPDIRFALILGLVLIESLVIYVLLISLILFFVQPFGR